MVRRQIGNFVLQKQLSAHVMVSNIPYLYRLAAAFLIPAVCAWFVSVVVCRLRPGWPRLVACVPVFAFNFWSPSIFDEQTQLISNLILNLCFVWLCNFKVFALCLNRGALSRRLSSLQFYTIYVAPVTPRDELEGSKRWSAPLRVRALSLSLCCISH